MKLLNGLVYYLFQIDYLVNYQIFHQRIYIFIFLKTFNSEFSYTEVRFADQNSKSLERKNKINVILVVNGRVTYRKWYFIQINLEIVYL